MTKPAPPKVKAANPPARRRRTSGLEALWHSSIGKKWVMAVTGLIGIAFLLLHMLGNLKIFFGPDDFNYYAHWLRTIGEPVLHGAWFLYILRAVLVIAIVLHITAAAQLSKRDLAARPKKYAHGQRAKATFATHTMRWGGVILLLFLVFHLLDLSAGETSSKFVEGRVYENVYYDFQHWYINLIYIVAMAALAFHVNHGFWSASQTLGINNPRRDIAIKATGGVVATALFVGFIMVPIGVMTGIVK